MHFNLDSVIVIMPKLILQLLKRLWSSEQWEGKDEMFKSKVLRYSFLLHGCSRSLSSSFWKYFVILWSSHLVIIFIQSRNLVLFEIRFSATLVNFNFFPLTVSMRFLSWRLENRRNSLVQTIQNHLDLSFFKYSKVCLFNPLHCLCNHISHLPLCIESEPQETVLWHILHGAKFG